jgi:DNA-binding FadR family transcriptional regulator
MHDAQNTASFISADVAFHLRIAKAAQEAMRNHLTNAGERLKGVIGLSGRVEPSAETTGAGA